jgi:molecular chaperone GrpE
MFFKKSKTMNHKTGNHEGQEINETDNLSQQDDSMDEAIARELNVDDSVPGTQHLDEQVTEDDQDSKLKQELDQTKDKYLRLVAEFDNYKRRTAREKQELTQTAGKDVLQSLLAVLDDTDRAAKQLETSEDLNIIKEGISLVFNKLRNTVTQKGLKKMESLHQPFDPELHEAIAEVPTQDESLQGKVMDEIEPGYYLNDKLIRHAKVVVGK